MMNKKEEILIGISLKTGINIQVYSLKGYYWSTAKRGYVKTTKYSLRWQTTGSSYWNECGKYKSTKPVMKMVKSMEAASQFMKFTSKPYMKPKDKG